MNRLLATICLMMAALLSPPIVSGDIAADGPPIADKVLVLKAQRKLYVIRGRDVLREMDIRLGLVPEGDKVSEGDYRTPEGSYLLDAKNPDSDFFLSIHISYPNRQDIEEAARMGTVPGGNIVIHGLPNFMTRDEEYYARADWTDGCIALSNSDMAELWRLTEPNTPIEILP